MLKEYLSKILCGENLTIDEATEVMNIIMGGEANPAQIAGLLVALKAKGEQAEEVAGFVRVMREHATKVALPDNDAVDGCGTGGDGSNSFNISTAAAVVASAAGVMVAKHGNRSVSSRCGSADLLEETGANIDPGREKVEDNLRRIGFAFMYAPRFHPAMKHAAGVRRELGVRTVFNILGPMTNPASVRRQLIGVYSRDLIPLMGEVLQMTGSKHVIIAHSRDGMDEFSVTAPTDYVELTGGTLRRGALSPEEVGLNSHPSGAVDGGDSGRNLAILRDVLDGRRGPHRDAVLFNSGAMIYVAGRSENIKEGVTLATGAIDSGRAKEKLDAWVKASVS